MKGGLLVLGYHGGSYSRAVMELFPELNFDSKGFVDSKKKASVSDVDIQRERKFFDRLAGDLEFGSHETTKWYNVSLSDVKQRKGGLDVLSNHHGSHVLALMDLYPELVFEVCKFKDIPKTTWQHSIFRREYFDQIAHDFHFDPSDSAKWYSLSLADIVQTKFAYHVLSYHNGSYVKALSDLYPELNLNVANFKSDRIETE